MKIEVEDIDGKKHVLDSEMCREVNFICEKITPQNNNPKDCSYYLEYWPLKEYDGKLIPISRSEFLKNV